MDTDKLIKKKLDELKERFYIELSNNHLYLAEDASAKALTIFFKSSLKEALQARDEWWKKKIREATQIQKACLCTEKRHCDAKGWNDAIDSVKEKLLNTQE